MGAGGQQNAKALQFAPVGPDGLHVAAQVQALNACQQKFSAEVLGLSAHGLRQRRAAGALHPGVIHHLVGNGDLAAELLFLHHDHTIFGSCQIDRGSQARGAAANDNNIIQILHVQSSFR